VVGGEWSAVELEIGQLVLHGFAPGDRQQIGETVERELARLLIERGLPPSLAERADLARLDGGAFDMAGGPQADDIGVAIARAIYSACGGELVR
jgi:hypothetical protein